MIAKRMSRRSGGRRRNITVLLATALVTAAVFWIIGLFVFVSYIPDQKPPINIRTDAIVVLTGGAGRVSEGLDLLKQKLGERLFVSGVYHGVDVNALLKVARQTPRDLEWRITLGYSADNTVGNARETAEWMAKQRFKSLRLVTASYHMPRSLLEFRRAMPDVSIIIHPVHPPQFKLHHWWLWPGSARLVISEYQKYLVALARGGLPG